MEYNFKVIAVLRDDLSREEREKAEFKISDLMRMLKMIQLETGEYVKPSSQKGLDGFGAANLFYLELEDDKQWFSQLRYYNLFQGVTCEAV